MYAQNHAFSLIELLIVLVIIGIVSVVSMAGYTSVMHTVRRTEAHTALHNAALLLEQCYGNMLTTIDFACNKDYTVTQNSTFINVLENESTEFYDIKLDIVTSHTFTLTAHAKGAQLQDTDCSILALDNHYRRTAYDTSGAEQTTCW